jgi:predicted enzyme related to lactoylglutathione lyase
VDRASDFYQKLFGWTAHANAVGKGTFGLFQLNNSNIGSVYQLNPRQLEQGTPSHWTPYVAVQSADETASRAANLGATVVIEPFFIPGIARITLLQDPVGALVGLWQRPDSQYETEQI